MEPAAPETLPARVRECERDLLRALAVRAKFPRDPWPAWPDDDRRRPPPPLAEILLAIAPAGQSVDPDAGNRGLIAALLARRRLACENADAKAAVHPEDFRAALAVGDRDQLALLLADLAAELRALDSIREAVPLVAPDLDPDLALLLWREHVLPWIRQTEIDHLAAP